MKKLQKHITIVGTGKVALQIAVQLTKTGHIIDGVWGRTTEKAKALAQKTHSQVFQSLFDIPQSSLVIICVADGAIFEVIQNIPSSIKVAYTSGSISIEDLPKRESLGVFYPLQTFSEGKKVDISEVPFLIEATSSDFEKELKELAKTLSKRVVIADSQDRYNTHIAAVMVNNFTNFLYHLAQKHLNEHQLDFDILKPLIKETVDKLETLTPLEAQTGPAARGDQKVIEKHIQSISDTETKELYRLFSKLINKETNKK